jgi:HPt (histidine-containing phosphotransfer) domain-containing protein
MAGDRERCLAHGMDGYLSKPIDAQEMIALIEGLAAGRASVLPERLPAEPSPQPPATVFNPELALKRCSDNEDLLAEMAKCFSEEAHSLLPQLRQALGKGDLAEVGRLGHRLKGTIVYLGAEPAEKTAIAVEEFLQGGEPAQAQEVVRAFEQECALLESALALHKGLISTVAAPS